MESEICRCYLEEVKETTEDQNKKLDDLKCAEISRIVANHVEKALKEVQDKSDLTLE